MAILAKSFFDVCFPLDANFAIAPGLVDFEDWPPVFEYTSVSRTNIFTFSFVDRT